MYNFNDVNEVSDGVVLPSEALKINGQYIEDQIAGYRTLNVQGREALSSDVVGYTTGVRDGSRIKSKRFPERIIIVTYQINAESNEAFREAYNKLAAILNVQDAELIFNDEQDKFFVGTPCAIGSVPPGKNCVVGEFEILCADPFKYSIVEYEAESNLVENGFLIDYKGTYKAFPTLEAEFYKENESDAALTGDGDCGYVAFFNDDKKIIQLGDPGEPDTEEYPKSQTLVMQRFEDEAAWGSITQANWASNSSDLIATSQTGNVGIAVCGYYDTYEPTLSGTLLTTKSTAASPNITYKVTATASDRQEDRINVKVTISATMPGKTTTSYKHGGYKVAAGLEVSLSRINLYVSSDSPSGAALLKPGKYYLWDDSVKNGRIRITTRKELVGKSGYVTGWVKVSDAGLSAISTKVVTTTGGLGKGYGLKCGIQLGSSWHYVTLKEENASFDAYGTYTKTLDVTVKELAADTTEIEDIKFKVERTDKIDDKIGIIEETNCANLEINTYAAPVANEWYLAPESYGQGNAQHGPTITRIIPKDQAGDQGAKHFTFRFQHMIAIGTRSYSTEELGAFHALLVSGTGTSKKILAKIVVRKKTSGKTATISLYVRNKVVKEYQNIDIGSAREKNCTITKSNQKLTFDVWGNKFTYSDSSIEEDRVTEINFMFSQFGVYPPLSTNGLCWAKFVKNNCDVWNNIPNKFSANDVLIVDCKSGEILLNGTPTPSLGALGNDWEEFYLTPGLNQIGYSYSDWVAAEHAPKCRVRYREVFV